MDSPERPVNPVNGCAVGVLLGALLWAVIILTVIALVRLF